VVSVKDAKSKPGKFDGKLSGTDCIVEPEDPAQVSIVSQPAPPTWNQMTFRVAPGSKTTVRLRLYCGK
jgi:hypothetical protein